MVYLEPSNQPTVGAQDVKRHKRRVALSHHPFRYITMNRK